MNEPSPRFWEIFFEVYEYLPRQGPGNRACAVRALGLCHELPQCPSILDLGCGSGGQTLVLAELVPSGSIVAMDSHAPFIEKLKTTIRDSKLSQRIRGIVGDMASPQGLTERFDLVWSEGALYSIGLGNALRVCHDLLRPGGYLVFTDAVWRREDPPPAVRAGFDMDYPEMGWLEDDIAVIKDCGFDYVNNFTLSEDAWWDDFYSPMENRIAQLRIKYANDVEASGILSQIAEEPELHRKYSDFYAYEFFIARRPLSLQRHFV